MVLCSFKLGDGEVERNGRVFTDMNQIDFYELLEQVITLKIISIWVSADLRAGREDEEWFNVLLKKV